jgi:ABC-type nitrate/sulfonate/bicarbonate transport system substrate-binding protein
MTHPAFDRRTLLAGGLSLAGMAALRGRSSAAATAGPLNVVMTEGTSGLTLQQMAKDLGIYKKFGIDPQVTLVSDGTKCVAALLSGESDICAWSGFNQIPPAIGQGATLKILAGSLSLPSLCLYSGKPEIRTVKDLRGKVIGIGSPGSVLDQMTVLLLQKSGVDPDAVTFRNVGSNADIFRAIAAKTVDAGLSDVDVFDQQAQFGVHALPDGLLWKRIPEYTNQGSYASDAAIKAKRDALVRVLAAWAATYRLVSGPKSREAFIQARAKVVGQNEEEHAINQWTWIQKNQPYATNLVLSDKQIDYVQQVNVDFHVQPKVLPIAQIADMSLAREALKLL